MSEDAAGADLESLKALAGLILKQEEGLADGSLAEIGGYVYPSLRAGSVPAFNEILAGLREHSRREGFWDDSGTYG